MAPHSARYLVDLVRELCSLPHETEWVEFKTSYESPESIGKYLSALANSAVLHDKPHGYVVWGVKNGTHELVVYRSRFSGQVDGLNIRPPFG